jgi:beta-phosphoglucomutase
MAIKAVIFDMDGVLVDAKDWHYDALNLALTDFGYDIISREDHESTYDGLSTSQKLNMLGIECDTTCQAINIRKQEHTMVIAEEKLCVNERHVTMMEYLVKQGYKVALASNSIRNTIEVFMTKTTLVQYLSFFLSNEDVTNPKPDPEIYIKAMSKLGLAHDECLIVEDNERGIAAARASGAWVMCVGGPDDVNSNSVATAIMGFNHAMR